MAQGTSHWIRVPDTAPSGLVSPAAGYLGSLHFLGCEKGRRVGGQHFDSERRSCPGSNSSSAPSWVTLSKFLNLSVPTVPVDKTLTPASNLQGCCEDEMRTPSPHRVSAVLVPAVQS